MDSRRVDEMVVRNVPEPEFTKTWHPISHNKLLDAIHESTKRNLGLEVVNKCFTLSKDGMDMFGSITFDTEYTGGKVSIGFRNSMKKHFAVGFCAGRYVIVCSNMQFHGEFMEFRKHTSGLDFDELCELSNTAVSSVFVQSKDFAMWHENLKQEPIGIPQSKILTYDAMAEGIIPPSQFKEFTTHFEDETTLYGRNMFSFYGGVTRLIRDKSLFSIQQTTKSLNMFTNDFIARQNN